jgi:hypothetical protein
MRSTAIGTMTNGRCEPERQTLQRPDEGNVASPRQ